MLFGCTVHIMSVSCLCMYTCTDVTHIAHVVCYCNVITILWSCYLEGMFVCLSISGRTHLQRVHIISICIQENFKTAIILYLFTLILCVTLFLMPTSYMVRYIKIILPYYIML